jgi:hypothetical protein
MKITQITEGYWADAVKKAEADRENRKGKPFEKNPASHDAAGVYKGDKDLAGNPVPKRKQNKENSGVEEGRYFKTAYGYAGGSRPGGGTYKHPEQIEADREAKKKAKEKEKNKEQKGMAEGFSDNYKEIYQEYMANGALNSAKGRKIQKEAEYYAGNMGHDAVEYYWVQRIYFDMGPGRAQVLTAHKFGPKNVQQGVAETSDYFRRRKREEDIISGKKPPRKKAAKRGDVKHKKQSLPMSEGVAKIACTKCDEVSTAEAWKKNNNFCPKCKTSSQGVAEGYRILPNIDRERYQEREGLEGPFRARNGKVYYYDPKAGMAYDPDTDFYIDYDELKMMDRETSETKKPDQVRASEPKPKKVKPNTGGQSPHPFQGRLVGENDDESIAVKLARLKQMLDQKDWERLSPEQKAEKLRKDRAEAEQRRSEYFDETSPPERNPVAKHASKFNKSNVQKDRKKDDQRGYQKHKKPGAVSETTGVTDYTPKSQGGTRKELLAKYAKTKDPKDAAAARKAGATQTELKAVSEQAGNRRFDKYLMHEFIITVEHADGSTKRYISRGLDEKAAREKILGYFDQAKIVDVEQVQ